jgi:peptidyl-prolyl cis-trans isomerase B (cyclophilin B)
VNVRVLASLAAVVWMTAAPARPLPPVQDEGEGPVLVVQTDKGAFAIQTHSDDAPWTVAHIVTLVERGFYDGVRVHRAEPGLIVQFGDPQTRQLALRDLWGRGPGASSGEPIGVAEITKKRINIRGAVGVAHPGNPALADSQIYIALEDLPQLDGQYAVFGNVTAGSDVPALLQVGDVIRRVFVRP